VKGEGNAEEKQPIMTRSMAKTSSKIDRGQQLRKVAILVATLDEPLAEQLLANLPAREEDAVRKLVEHLGDIDPDEYRAVVADFRSGIVSPSQPTSKPSRTQLEGVELDASLLARMADEDFSSAMPETKQGKSPWQTLSDADVATLVEMLSAEQPQTIAVVLSRLETSRSAELITKLSPTLQAEVLTRLAELDPADEQTLDVVASQLAQWLDAQRQRRQRMAAGCDLVQRILRDTSEGHRVTLLARLSKRNPTLAEKLSVESHTSQPFARPSSRLPTTYQPQPQAATFSNQPPIDVAAPSIEPTTEPTTDHLSELESLDDSGLLRALRQADRQTVMLALAGASESLMKRIVKDLPRRKANQFRQQVRAIGPTRLSEIIAAQRELLRCGRESQGAGQLTPPQLVTRNS